MGLVVRRAHVILGDPRVDLGRSEVGVAEHRLHGAEIGAAAEEVRREGVTERMGADVPLNSSSFDMEFLSDWMWLPIPQHSLEWLLKSYRLMMDDWLKEFVGFWNYSRC